MNKAERRIETLKKSGWTVTEDETKWGIRTVELEKVTKSLVRGEGGVTMPSGHEEYHRKQIEIYDDGTYDEATR